MPDKVVHAPSGTPAGSAWLKPGELVRKHGFLPSNRIDGKRLKTYADLGIQKI